MKQIKRILPLILLLLVAGCTTSTPSEVLPSEPSISTPESETTTQSPEMALEPRIFVSSELTATYDNTDHQLSAPQEYADGTSATVTIQYPQITNPQTDFEREANLYFESVATQLCQDSASYLEAGTEAVVTTVDYSYEVMRSDDIISVLFTGLRGWGGAYMENLLLTYTFYGDGSTAMTVEDFIQDNQLDQLADQLIASESYEVYQDLIAEEAFRSQLHSAYAYVTETELVVTYPEEWLGPHALGTPTFRIDLTEVEDLCGEGLQPLL